MANLQTLSDIFGDIYSQNLWHGRESKSGRGSDITETKELITRLPIVLSKYAIKSICDAPCGDLNWMSKVNLGNIKYVGVDIVLDLINNNKKKFKDRDFECIDISDVTGGSIPCVDLILCRDCLVHLSYARIFKVLDNFIKSGSKYILLTSFTKDFRTNNDMTEDRFGWRVLTFTKAPFNFLAPLYTINERCPEPGFDDKCLLLYELKTLEPFVTKYIETHPKECIEEKAPMLNEIPSDSWKLSKTPKLAYFYWGLQPLPFLRYMTLYSFCKFNPDWKVILYQPGTNTRKNTWTSGEHPIPFSGKDYMSELEKLPVEIKKIPIDFYPDYPEVFKSDLLRWKLLSETGGFWIDMDILFFRPMNMLGINIDRNKNIDTIVNYFEWNKMPIHSIGFLGSCPGNKFYNHIWNKAKKHKINFSDYQTLGNYLIHTEFKTLEDIKKKFGQNIETVSKETVYAYFSLKCVNDLFKTPVVNILKRDSIGIHWYAGAEIACRWVNKINATNYKSYKNIICQLIEKIY